MEFKKYKIKDITNVVTDYVANGSFKSLKENVNFSDNEDYAILIRLVDYNNNFKGPFKYVDMKGYEYLEKTKLFGEEIIISNVGANAGTVFKVPCFNKPMTLGPNSIMVNLKGDNDYFYYYFKSIIGQSKLKSILSGSAQPKFNKTDFKNIDIEVPDLKSQVKIGGILKKIDKKIENNRNIIANLEELSQTLFKRWFVDFEFPDKDGNPYKSSGGEMVDSELGEIPKEWQVVKLETLIDNVKDRINAKSVSSNFPYVPIDLIPKRKLTFYNYKDGKEAKSSLIKFKRNDILLGNMRVYFHRVCLAPFEGVTRNTVFTLRPKDEKYTYYLINLINKDEFIEYASNNSKGSTMPYAVWEGVLDKIKVIKPSLNYLNQFNSKIKSNFELSISLLEQNRKLAILRDTLLPKLMSGEVEIPNDIEVNSDEFSI